MKFVPNVPERYNQKKQTKQNVQEMYNPLATKQNLYKKKFVVPPEEILKLQNLIGNDFHPV